VAEALHQSQTLVLLPPLNQSDRLERWQVVHSITQTIGMEIVKEFVKNRIASHTAATLSMNCVSKRYHRIKTQA
jgi:hypothetical protein